MTFSSFVLGSSSSPASNSGGSGSLVPSATSAGLKSAETAIAVRSVPALPPSLCAIPPHRGRFKPTQPKSPLSSVLRSLAAGVGVILLAASLAASAAPMEPLNAWAAVDRMTPGINIGNTFENTEKWETGWGSPRITKGFIQSLARMGFKSVRLPVAWDTFSDRGRITAKQFRRIDEIVNWILESDMFCVVNIHWDGGWIDSGEKEKFPDTHHTFSKDAEKKFRSYWDQIARHYADKSEKLLFEGLNEESNFENEGSMAQAQATLTRVNQLFVDTVRQTGGNNAQRLLIVAGYGTDFGKTCQKEYELPKDSVPGKLFVSVHYYTPWTFVGLDEDSSWGKVRRAWGSPEDVKELEDLFDGMEAFCQRTNTPAYVGEFSMCSRKEKASSVRWTTSVFQAARKRKMVPVLWDTGGAVSRKPPYEPRDILLESQIIRRNANSPTE